MKIGRPESKLLMPKTARLIHDGVIFKAYQWPQKIYDGDATTFEKLTRSDTVNIIAATDGKIMLTKQENYRELEVTVSIARDEHAHKGHDKLRKLIHG